MLWITKSLSIPETEIETSAVRSQGAGGQNVNKVATAVQLRFDIPNSSLPEPVKQRLLGKEDNRLTKDGVLVIKAQESRSQDRNHQQARERLATFVRSGTVAPKRRIPTKPSQAAKRKRLERKTRRGQIKAKRGKVTDF